MPEGTIALRAFAGAAVRPQSGQAQQIRLQRRKLTDSGRTQIVPHVVQPLVCSQPGPLHAQLLWTQHGGELGTCGTGILAENRNQGELFCCRCCDVRFPEVC